MNGARTPPASASPERERSTSRAASPEPGVGAGVGSAVQPQPQPHSPTPTPPLTASRPPSDISLGSEGHSHRRASLTARNLGRIPDADEVAPGIRLPGSHDEDARRREHREMEAQEEERMLQAQRRGSEGTPLGSEMGGENVPGMVGHYGEGGAPVAGVPPELDPRTSKYRPPSPGAASVFSVAVQPPRSPKVFPTDPTPDSHLAALEYSDLSSPAPDLSSMAAGLGMGAGGMGTPHLPSPSRRGSATGISLSGATTGSSSRPPSPGIALPRGSSPPGTPSFLASPAVGPLGSSSVGGAGHASRARSTLAAVVSQAPSEYGSVSSEGHGESYSLSSRAGGAAGGARGDEASIEALRMREREMTGGEAGVGGLGGSRPLFAPGLVALRSGENRRAASTAATVGTSSPTPSLGGVSELPDAADKAPSRRGSSGSGVTLASLRPPSRLSDVGDGEQGPKRGALLVIEGLDRAGKSTQVERLVQELDARLVKFPDRTTPIGRMLDSYLQQKSELDDRAVHLLFSANRWELAPSIKADLEAGKTVVCDRYAFSGIAYSVAKGLPFEWCLSSDASLPAPDLTLFLTLSPSVAATRGGYGAERYEDEALQTRVRAAFEELETRYVREWRSIDAERSVEEVWRDVSEAAEAAVRHAHGPVRQLFA